MDIKVPNLGDGIESAIVISILVSPGDSVTKDQTLFELETDKAVAPMPCPADGVIDSISVAEGDTVSEGSVVGALAGGSAASTDAPSPASAKQEAPSPAPAPTAAPVASVPVVAAAAPVGFVNENPVTSASLQKLAYRIGLDLRRVAGTGSGGRITDQDIVNHMAHLQALLDQPQQVAAPVQQAAPAPEKKIDLPDFSKWGDIEIEKLSSLRKKIAQKMTDTWNSVPAVTQNLDVDITALMALRKKMNPLYQEKGAKLTLTVFAIKAVQQALAKFPQFNSSYNPDTNELIKKNYFHMGIAVDTENGLIVPVIKDVDKKSYLELCHDLTTVANKAKDRSLGVDELQGSTFTISNLGGLGVGTFTPIVNTPEVAILGMSAGENKAQLITKNGKKRVQFHMQMPLSLSYDHRVIDGADAARFIMAIKEGFENISEQDLEGGLL